MRIFEMHPSVLGAIQKGKKKRNFVRSTDQRCVDKMTVKKAPAAIYIIAAFLIIPSGCHTPRYYTKYKKNNKNYDQHYNPYSTKWYKWTYRRGII